MQLLTFIPSGNTLAIFVICVVAIVVLAIGTARTGRRQPTRSVIKPRQVLTLNEQPMYFRLVEALPDHVVLAQVAFSALLDTRLQATRNTFDRKVADFVICTKSFHAIAIVELDDASHRGKEREDKARDHLLASAGYKVLRYKHTPGIETIRYDFVKRFANDRLIDRRGNAMTAIDRTEPTL